MTQHPEDLPWNDVPADNDVWPGTEEPDPAEVTGTEDDDAVRDTSLPRTPRGDDEYRQESLDERLAEEEPDETLQAQDPQTRPLLAPEPGQDDMSATTSEPDADVVDQPDDEPAEEAAVHVVSDDRVM
ncbi:MAG: hypothetical protein ABR498_06655 [Candidatus Dormibacteria bacterium]